MNELLVLLEGREVGRVAQRNGKLTFTYENAWREAPGAYPLSLSMPLAAAEHPHAAIDPFLWGLLPDNELVLSRWAQKFQVSPRNAFALISHVGEDCAGAVQFVTQQRRDELANTTPAETEWLTEAEVANRLRALQADVSASRSPRDTGQFSLAGAQPKTALLFDGQRWGVPSGRMPTTHILKPPTTGFDGHAENEHLCLRLAQALGLPTAHSEVRKFEDVTTIVVERYDRVDIQRLTAATSAQVAAKASEAAMHAASNDTDSAAIVALLVGEATDLAASAKSLADFSKTTRVYRVHQEDFCQALHVHPSLKYQNDGGPSPRQIVDRLRSNVSSANRKKEIRIPNANEYDVFTFIDALIFNWMIGGTDAHAKNYSLLIGGGGMVRLAPLYDIASIFAYPDIDPHKAKLAMKIGDEYRLRYIGLSDWRKLAESVHVDGEALIDRLRAMALEVPDCLSDEIRTMRASGLNHNVLDTLSVILPERMAGITAL
jgi:serine/threonine-protein kinase HipA